MDNSNKNIELQDLGSRPTQLDDAQVLHMAASILQHSMAGINKEDTNISSMDINIEHCSEYVPSIMHDFVMWCVKGNTFKTASNCCDEGQQNNDLKIISICHTLINRCEQVCTPIALGLSICVHHNFGSRKLRGTAFPWVLCLI